MKKKKEQFMLTSYLQDAIKAIPNNPSIQLLHDVIGFEEILVKQQDVASKKGLYDGLDEWNDAVYHYIQKMLDKNGFINGHKDQNPYASFWWKIYPLPSNVCWSPNLKGDYDSSTHHHATAYDRNECMLLEIQYLLTKFPNNIQYEI